MTDETVKIILELETPVTSEDLANKFYELAEAVDEETAAGDSNRTEKR